MINDCYEIFFSRINAYRALASPSLISLSSKVSSDISHTILLSLFIINTHTPQPNKDPNIQTDHVTSQDPILTAFELSWELRQLAFSEFEFKSEYLVRLQLYTLTSTMMRSFSFQDIELFTILVHLFVSIY